MGILALIPSPVLKKTVTLRWLLLSVLVTYRLMLVDPL